MSRIVQFGPSGLLAPTTLPVMFQPAGLPFQPADYFNRLKNIFGKDFVWCMPLLENQGTTAYELVSGGSGNGTYVGPVQPGTPGIGDRNTAPNWNNDAVTHYVDMCTPYFQSVFNGFKGTSFHWQLISDATWKDVTAVRQTLHSQADPANEVGPSKAAVINAMRYNYTAGGVSNIINPVVAPIPYWHCAGMTWGDLNNGSEARGYHAGRQVGITMTPSGIWAGVPVKPVGGSPGTCIADKNLVLGGPFTGGMCWHCLINRIATPAEMLAVAQFN